MGESEGDVMGEFFQDMRHADKRIIIEMPMTLPMDTQYGVMITNGSDRDKVVRIKIDGKTAVEILPTGELRGTNKGWAIPALPVHEAEDAQGMLYVWMCPLCGQPLPQGERCNSGAHQGPSDAEGSGPRAVRSIDLVEGRPHRGDAIEAWLKRMRDVFPRNDMRWQGIDFVLDWWRECSDYGLSLRPEDDEHGDP